MSAASKDPLKLSNSKQERKFSLQKDEVTQKEFRLPTCYFLTVRELRKPLIERKRRERINSCLEQLKETVIRAFHLDQSKLEKADILEMTVRHLENIQRSRTTGEEWHNLTGETSQTVDGQQRFSTGYIQCMHELHNLLLNCDWMDPALGARLLNHLLKSLPKAMDAKSELPFMIEEGAGRTPSLTLKSDTDTKPQVNVLQKHCPLMGSLQMWRPW